MAFAGSAVISQVSDRIVRITGLSLPAGKSGSIALHGGNGAVQRLGAASPFALLAKTYVNDFVDTILNGDLGYITAPSVAPTVSGSTHVNDATYVAAVAALNTALTELLALAPTFSFAPGNIDLATDNTHGDVGIYTPGIYDVAGNMTIDDDAITLSGNGLYVFRSTGTFTVNDSVVCVAGADPDDVWWIPDSTADINASLDFVGNVAMLAQFALTIGQGGTWLGRALGALPGGLGSSITTEFDTDPATITVPDGLGDTVFLPAAFQCAPFTYDRHNVGLRDAIECSVQDAEVLLSQPNSPIAIVKSGTTVSDFLITLTNVSQQDSLLQEIYVQFH